MRFIPAILLFFSVTAHAQMPQEFGYWQVHEVFVRVGRFQYALDAQLRLRSEFAPGDQVFLIRPYASYAITANQFLGLGYAYQAEFDMDISENRIFQQYLRQDQIRNNIILINRTRLEQRFGRNDPTVANRIRQQVRATIRPGEESQWTIIIYDEVFVNLNRDHTLQKTAGLAQNRFYIGMRRNMRNGFYLEGGYLNQTLTDQNRAMFHIPTITIGKVINVQRRPRPIINP